MDRIQKLHHMVEEGKMLQVFQIILFVSLLLVWLISGISFSGTHISSTQHDHVKRYRIEKVSSLPKKAEKDDSREIKSDDNSHIDDAKKRYIKYVISKIEKNKIYPIREQKLSHEDVTRFFLHINRDGKIMKMRFFRKSRYQGLNSASIKSVKRALPLVSYPEIIPEDVLEVPIEMDFHLQ